MKIFVTLVMTLVGLSLGASQASMATLDSSPGSRAIACGLWAAIGAGAGLWFGRLIVGPSDLPPNPPA